MQTVLSSPFPLPSMRVFSLSQLEMKGKHSANSVGSLSCCRTSFGRMCCVFSEHEQPTKTYRNPEVTVNGLTRRNCVKNTAPQLHLLAVALVSHYFARDTRISSNFSFTVYTRLKCSSYSRCSSRMESIATAL